MSKSQSILVIGSTGQIGHSIQSISIDYPCYEFVFVNRQHLDLSNEISITNSDIIITILDHKEIIQHQTKRWTTLFISYASDTHTTHYKYSVNGISGELTSSINVNPISGITIGSRYDDTRFFVGQLSCLEIYTRAVPTLLPNAMQRLVIANQEMV